MRRQLATQQARTDTAIRQLRQLDRGDVENSAKAALEVLAAIGDGRCWRPEAVATATGIPAHEASALRDFLSTSFGAQPTFHHPLACIQTFGSAWRMRLVACSATVWSSSTMARSRRSFAIHWL